MGDLTVEQPVIRFRVVPDAATGGGELRYLADELAFSTDIRDERAQFSVMVNRIELWIEPQHMQVLYVGGYCPHKSWRTRELLIPRASKGGLFLEAVLAWQPGIAFALNEAASDLWPVTVDLGSGWVCIGEPSSQHSSHVAFAPGASAYLDEGVLRALWLHPATLPSGLTKARLI